MNNINEQPNRNRLTDTENRLTTARKERVGEMSSKGEGIKQPPPQNKTKKQQKNPHGHR